MKIYFFGTDWSYSCKAAMATWEKFRFWYPDLETSYIDIRKRPDLANRYVISTVPTFISVDNGGNEYKRFTRRPTTIDLKNLVR